MKTTQDVLDALNTICVKDISSIYAKAILDVSQQETEIDFTVINSRVHELLGATQTIASVREQAWAILKNTLTPYQYNLINGPVPKEPPHAIL